MFILMHIFVRRPGKFGGGRAVQDAQPSPKIPNWLPAAAPRVMQCSTNNSVASAALVQLTS